MKTREEIERELARARKDAETWRALLAGAKTHEGEQMAMRGIADAQKRERDALALLYHKCVICGRTRADEWRDGLGGYVCDECAPL